MQVNQGEELDWCGYKIRNPYILETGYIINQSMNTWRKKYKLSGENYGPEIKINSSTRQGARLCPGTVVTLS